ncbi:MAG TPA: hypothetical protein VN017_06385, partial [Pseudoxanthomonas sp.]|nr:hypothetical protein [Pseudoxanthomonas sp.]
MIYVACRLDAIDEAECRYPQYAEQFTKGAMPRYRIDIDSNKSAIESLYTYARSGRGIDADAILMRTFDSRFPTVDDHFAQRLSRRHAQRQPRVPGSTR